jgi:hypothetical protein
MNPNFPDGLSRQRDMPHRLGGGVLVDVLEQGMTGSVDTWTISIAGRVAGRHVEAHGQQRRQRRAIVQLFKTFAVAKGTIYSAPAKT